MAELSDIDRWRRRFVGKCDLRLHSLFRAASRRDAEKAFNHLHAEHIGMIITMALSYELRRELAASTAQLYAENDIFRDLALWTRGKLAVRLLKIWEQLQSPSDNGIAPITDVSAYTSAIARHVCVDYLRRKYPGRHSLCIALRTAFDVRPGFSRWRVRLDSGTDSRYEWRCGLTMHQDLQPHRLLTDPVLTAQLTDVLRDVERNDALPTIFTVVSPLRYGELLSFLAQLWDVENARAWEQQTFLWMQKSYTADVPPEAAAELIGALQAFWPEVKMLRQKQAAVLLLRMPQEAGGTYLDLLVRHNIATWEEIARTAGLTVQQVWRATLDMPLDDTTIATLLELTREDVARIRQDARRRLRRNFDQE